jgi:N-acyl-phosphatidylethanolamine-hydrolysing phospholipase D
MAPSHHRREGGFRNPWPGVAEHGFGDVLRWQLGRIAAHLPEDPDVSAFPRAAPAFAQPRAPAEEVTVTWVGHSTVLAQIGGLNVLTDPVWSERASPLSWAGPRRWVVPGVDFDALPPLDLVLLSHNHYDHLDDRTVRRLAARHPAAHWAVPLGLAAFVRERGAREVSELDWWGETTVGAARLVCVPAQHFSARGLGDRMRTLWCSWAVRVSGRALYFGGDSAYHSDFTTIGERHGPFDVTLLPIGAYEPRWFMRVVHMDPDEAVRAFLDLNACRTPARRAVMVGVHWGTFKLTAEAMDEPPRRAERAWRAAGLAEGELWVMRHGETRMLY